MPGRECLLSSSVVSCMQKATWGKKVQERWREDQGLRPIEEFTDHITSSVLQYYFDTDVYNMGKNISSFKRPNHWHPNLNKSDVTAALVHEACTLAVAVVRITGRQSDSRLS